MMQSSPLCRLLPTLVALLFWAPSLGSAFVVQNGGIPARTVGCGHPHVESSALSTLVPSCGHKHFRRIMSLNAEDDKEKTAEPQQQQQQDEVVEETTAAGEDGDVTDILNSPAFLSRKLDVLKSDVAKLEEELKAANERVEVAKEEWGPQLEQLTNEYSNIRERMSSQSEQGDAKAIVTVVKEVLDLLDNFDRAYGVIKPETPEDEAILAEFKAAYQAILDTFAELGVVEVKTVGTEFDYELHQAIMQMPGTEYDEGIVCQEFQKGFIMGEETLIRPAMVAVAA